MEAYEVKSIVREEVKNASKIAIDFAAGSFGFNSDERDRREQVENRRAALDGAARCAAGVTSSGSVITVHDLLAWAKNFELYLETGIVPTAVVSNDSTGGA